MADSKQDILGRLKNEILVMQGGSMGRGKEQINIGLDLVKEAFPQGCFPAAGIHEFISTGSESKAVSGGFIAALLNGLLKSRGICVWISTSRILFPPALATFGVPPDKIIFIDVKKENEALWAMEEVLKCDGFAAVIGEIQNISFTESRRLQLAVEQSRVTGFVLRNRQKNISNIACVARWQISSLKSRLPGSMPGVGFPHWKVELLKVRNGKPGSWNVEWVNGSFRTIEEEKRQVLETAVFTETRKAG